MKREIDTEFTRNITCPYCGWQDADSCDTADEGELECGDCEKEFTFRRIVDVTYCTEKKGAEE